MAQSISLPQLHSITDRVQSLHLPVLPHKRSARLAIIGAGIVLSSVVVWGIIAATHQSAAPSQNSIAMNQQTLDNTLPLSTGNTAAYNTAINPAVLTDSTNNQQASISGSNILINGDSSVLPGHIAPTNLQCGRNYQAKDFGNVLSKDCMTKHIAGYKLVQMTVDASSGMILGTTFYVSGIKVMNLVQQWGKPLGFNTTNYSSVIYWSGHRAYLTSGKINPADQVAFITFDSLDQHYQPWTDFK